MYAKQSLISYCISILSRKSLIRLTLFLTAEEMFGDEETGTSSADRHVKMCYA